MQQYHKDKVSRANNRLAKEAMKVHQLQKEALPGGLDNPNVKEVVNTMSMLCRDWDWIKVLKRLYESIKSWE